MATMQLFLKQKKRILKVMWTLKINCDKPKILIFGTRRDQHFNFNLDSHKINIYADFNKSYVDIATFMNATSYCLLELDYNFSNDCVIILEHS